MNLEDLLLEKYINYNFNINYPDKKYYKVDAGSGTYLYSSEDRYNRRWDPNKSQYINTYNNDPSDIFKTGIYTFTLTSKKMRTSSNDYGKSDYIGLYNEGLKTYFPYKESEVVSLLKQAQKENNLSIFKDIEITGLWYMGYHGLVYLPVLK